MVEKILEDFKSGKETYAPFWIQMGPKFVHIAYYALKDDNGDYMKLTLGDDPLIEVSKRYKLEDKTHTYSTTLDDDGKIVINILNYSDSDSGAEWLDIDDFQIKSNNYKYDLTLNAKKTDDSETLSEIEIKDLPHGAYLLNGDTKLTATDGVYTINNTTTCISRSALFGNSQCL